MACRSQIPSHTKLLLFLEFLVCVVRADIYEARVLLIIFVLFSPKGSWPPPKLQKEALAAQSGHCQPLPDLPCTVSCPSQRLWQAPQIDRHHSRGDHGFHDVTSRSSPPSGNSKIREGHRSVTCSFWSQLGILRSLPQLPQPRIQSSAVATRILSRRKKAKFYTSLNKHQKQ